LAQAIKNLSVSDHRRDSAGLTYVYPVLSRRSGGISIGINLNPNNACNWRCIYCQVPELVRGPAPTINVKQLETELSGLLKRYLAHGELIKDIALSGNGEPTSASEFELVVERIVAVIRDHELVSRIKLVLITNGSLIHRRSVQAGLRRMADANGEVWFKIDRGSREDIKRINDVDLSVARISANLALCASLCRTWVQTCMFAIDGMPPTDKERRDYLLLLKSFVEKGIKIEGVLLYGLAREPQQPEGPRLSPLPEQWLRELGREIQALGVAVRISP
jgi:wyosine [tRNA(Phe)-imidazoG37] synthetase (radical SAM superfamily)